MKTSESTRTIIAIFIVAALSLAFWVLVLAPKRKEAGDLEKQVTQLQSSLSQSQSDVLAGERAQREFPREYQQLVVLGKAVPAGDESASLLVQVNHISENSKVKFESLKVGTSTHSEEAPAAETPPATSTTTPEESKAKEGGTEASGSEAGSTAVPTASAVPTEAVASQLPIGAKVGPAGLSVLPYDLSFKGSFFHVADFIQGVDSMIHTGGSDVAVNGRLVTVDGFSLAPGTEGNYAKLNANFAVTTFLVPQSQGITAGASPTEPTVLASNPSPNSSSLR